MKKNILLLTMILLLTASFNCLNAQKNTEEKFEGTIGIGGGLDYGGLGFNLTGYADKRLAGFFGAGYNLAGLGYGGGLKYRFRTKNNINKANFFVLAMCGYNAFIKVPMLFPLIKTLIMGQLLELGWIQNITGIKMAIGRLNF